MNRGVLALFVRSMREDSRRMLPYIGRVALVLLVLFVVTITQQTSSGGGAPGLRVFLALSWLNFGFITVIGLTYFAAAITEEKEDGTLGLLRMTNLNPVSILLGKSTSRLVGALLLVIAQVPFTILAITLGGVSGHQVLSIYVVLAAYTFLLSNLALVFSVVCRKTSSAVVMTLIVLLLSTVGWWFVARFIEALLGEQIALFETFGEWLLGISPIPSVRQIFRTGFNEVLVYQPLSNVVLGVILFGISWALFDVFNQGEGRGMAKPSKKFAVSEQAPYKTRPFKKPRPGAWAIVWRDFYFHFGGVARQVLILAMILVTVVIILIYVSFVTDGMVELKNLAPIFITLGTAYVVLRLAVGAASIFKFERRGNTLSALALLPKSMRRVAYEKVFALLLALVPGILSIVFGLMLIEDIRSPRLNQWGEVFVGIFFTLSWIVFALHLIAYLSLYLRWGALPIGAMACFVLWMLVLFMFAMVFQSSNEELVFVFIGLCFCCLTVALHLLIGKRLLQIAAEA